MNPAQVPEIADAQLVERAVRYARPEGRIALPRWACVKQTFSTGSTVSAALCRRFGLDPDEYVQPPVRDDSGE